GGQTSRYGTDFACRADIWETGRSRAAGRAGPWRAAHGAPSQPIRAHRAPGPGGPRSEALMLRKNLLCAAGTLVVLALAAGCRDNPTDPATSEMRIELRRGDVPFQEETLAPGATLQLNAKLI